MIDLTQKILNYIVDISYGPSLVINKYIINSFLSTLTRIQNPSMYNMKIFNLPLSHHVIKFLICHLNDIVIMIEFADSLLEKGMTIT